jgi:uncharacterized RDD family membrane protein YckC
MVHPEADEQIIKVAYRRLAQQYHPDVYHGSDATQRMTLINEAYQVLNDPRARAEYDSTYGQQSRGRTATAVEEPQVVPQSWQQIMAASRLLEEIEERTKHLANDTGTAESRQLSETLYGECMNVLRFLESLTADDIEREAIDYMRASAHITAAMVRIHRPGYKDISSLNFGDSTVGSIANLMALGVGSSSSHAQAKQNLWHYQTSLEIYEMPVAHLMIGYCYLDQRHNQSAAYHFQKASQLDQGGPIGIEASKEMIRIGAYSGKAVASAPNPRSATAKGSLYTPNGLLSYASFGQRVGASIIDNLIILVPSVLLWLALGRSGNSTELLFAIFSLQLVYYAGMESSSMQATLGKMAMGLRVTDMSGKRITFIRAAIKHLLRAVNSYLAIACVGVFGWLTAALTPRKQTIYECLSSTVTVCG